MLFVISLSGITASFSDEWAHELCRYGGAEMHTVSAFMGNIWHCKSKNMFEREIMIVICF